MAQLSFNVTLVDQNLQLSSLERYVETIEGFLPMIADQLVVRAKAQLRRDGHDAASGYYRDVVAAERRYSDEMYPQLFRAQSVVAAHSLIEGAVGVAATQRAKERGVARPLHRRKAENDRERWRAYFTDDLDLPLNFSEDVWQQLHDLAAVRHVLAHTGGLRGASRFDGSALRQIVKRREGLEIDTSGATGVTQVTEIKPVFVQAQLELAKQVLSRLEVLLGGPAVAVHM